MTRSFFLSTALSVLCVAVAAAACDNPPVPVACTDIPAGGCPEDNGADVCGDPTCAVVYACSQGQWVRSQTCPARPQDASASEASTLDAAPPEAGPPADAPFDAPPGAYGGPGCTDLQMPDCDVGTALACLGEADCCGCEDLWVCQNGGWVPWGQCADGGLVSSRP
jgi:hypothetical protein